MPEAVENPPVEPCASVKYVLYTHYAYREADDFKAWSSGTACNELAGVRYVAEHLKGLCELLTSPAYEGILVMFYATGFAECLDGIAKGKRRDELLAQNDRIRFAAEVGESIGAILRSYRKLPLRVRVITPIDLYDIFGRMNWATAQNLRWWFIGKSQAIRYDTPKIVEAIVRLRLFGSGVPVFRLDYDVLFRGDENKDLPDLGLFKTVASCLRAYRLRMDEPSVATFLLSASYDTRALVPPENSTSLAAWRGALATRVFPALPVVPDEIKRVRRLEGKEQYTWERYAETVFDSALARKFYGLAENDLVTEGVAGIGKIGAHPIASVVSGAMLCLSEGAILDLPPFSNFTLNVSWIDDHLKYCLHRELRHLTTIELKIEPLLSDAKLDPIMVQKARAQITDLPSYVLGNYLPTVLWGTVVDAWTTANPLIKYRPEHLSAADQASWHKIKRHGQSDGVLAAALQTALEKGSFITAERLALRDTLIRVGLERITEVRKQWATLTGPGTETFASLWAKGTVSSFFAGLSGRCRGIAEPDAPLQDELKETIHLNYHLHDDFLTLVDDALEYIEWTLNWPRIVQVVRSVEQGTVKTDISWKPEDRG
jgi:hypothetical protein